MTSSSSPVKQSGLRTPITKSSETSVTSASCPAITVPVGLTSALSMMSSSNQSGARFMDQPKPNSLTRVNSVKGQILSNSTIRTNNVRRQFSSNNTVTPPAMNKHMDHSPPTGASCQWGRALYS